MKKIGKPALKKINYNKLRKENKREITLSQKILKEILHSLKTQEFITSCQTNKESKITNHPEYATISETIGKYLTNNKKQSAKFILKFPFQLYLSLYQMGYINYETLRYYLKVVPEKLDSCDFEINKNYEKLLYNYNISVNNLINEIKNCNIFNYLTKTDICFVREDIICLLGNLYYIGIKQNELSSEYCVTQDDIIRLYNSHVITYPELDYILTFKYIL